jgi:hypothetical protein
MVFRWSRDGFGAVKVTRATEEAIQRAAAARR